MTFVGWRLGGCELSMFGELGGSKFSICLANTVCKYDIYNLNDIRHICHKCHLGHLCHICKHCWPNRSKTATGAYIPPSSPNMLSSPQSPANKCHRPHLSPPNVSLGGKLWGKGRGKGCFGSWLPALEAEYLVMTGKLHLLYSVYVRC